jgi:predicted dehydrogenase
MTDIRIGIVGSGGMARRRAQAFADLEGSTVQAVAARNYDTGAPLADGMGVELTNWEQLVERDDIDAVAACTNNDSHGTIASAALAAGKSVFVEYPLARELAEVDALLETVQDGQVIRVAHGEAVSAEHRALRAAVAELGELMTAVFVVLFFVYHVYALVDLFGAASWVDASCRYDGLEESTGRYDRFHNTVTAGLAGGTATWSWSGGIEIDAAEQYERLVLTGGSLSYDGGAWTVATSAGREPLAVPDDGQRQSLESLFLRDVRGEDTGWRQDLAVAADAARLCLRAERAMTDGADRILTDGRG